MPTIRVELFEGRSDEMKKRLVAELTEAACRSLECTPDSVDIILAEVRREHWATAGVLWSERR